MTVRDAIAILSTQNPDAILIIQKDAEGNDYSPLSNIDGEARYHAETTWHGEVYRMNDEDGPKDGAECVVLVPVN
mgnify:CR=1 FL=1